MVSVSEELKSRQTDILFNASKDMRDLKLEESETSTGLVTNEIFELENVILNNQRPCTLHNFKTKWETVCEKIDFKLSLRRNCY